ncbi:MAG: SDR family NAD(P)-dependent oxidoreductase [Alphaproteobacteria bacterium]
MSSLAGRVAMITGGGSGIGRATALIMAGRGADIAVVDLNGAGAEETAARVRAQGRRALVFAIDVSDGAAVRAAGAMVEAEWGAIDILCNNAGIASDRRPVEEVTEEFLDRQIAVHVKGALFATQAAVPGMKRRRYGKIVNTSSVNGTVGSQNCGAYNAAKGALLAMAKGWAKEFAPWNIAVNVVAPGEVMTPMPMAHDSPELMARIAETIPLKRYAQPEEIGYAIAYLCSSEADFVTGQVLSPNGGAVIT